MAEATSILISIVTPCLNRAGYIREAIESVERQDYLPIEHIIVDGGSTDGTLDVLALFPNLRVMSQPDEGIYDALNKGLRWSSGNVIGFLNSDDLYEPGTFGTIANTFREHPDIAAVVGGSRIFYDRPPGERQTYNAFPSIPSGELWSRATIGAPIFNAWFFRKRLFDTLGEFNKHLQYVADREFLFRIAAGRFSYVSLDRIVYHYRMHPGSYTLSGEDSGEAGYMFESRALAELWLSKKNLDENIKRCFLEWHSQVTFEQIRTAWHKKAFGRIIRYLARGMRYNPGWPVFFLRKSWLRFFGTVHTYQV